MPGFDETGPAGCGSVTGGRRGTCASDAAFEARGARSGGGRGRGGHRGRGHRNQYYASGLTGWQRAVMGTVPEATPGTRRIDPIEQQPEDVLDRLAHLGGPPAPRGVPDGGLGAAAGGARGTIAAAAPDPATIAECRHASQGPPAGRAAAGTARLTDAAACNGCGLCADVCATSAIALAALPAIDAQLCTGCGACVSACPAGVLAVVPL